LPPKVTMITAIKRKITEIFHGVDDTDYIKTRRPGDKGTRRMGGMEGKEVLKLGSWEDGKKVRGIVV